MACFCFFWNTKGHVSFECNRFWIKAVNKPKDLDLVSDGDGTAEEMLIWSHTSIYSNENYDKFKVLARSCSTQTLCFSIAVYLNLRMLWLINKHLV